MLKEGDPAPDFELPDAEMNMVRLSDLRGKLVVIYFYPKDDTPGCTLEATEFSELMEEFQNLGVRVLGISPDNCISHADFRDKYGLLVDLLADVDSEVCQAYGVIQEKEVNGEKRTGVQRSTFVIDGDGVIRHALYGVAPRNHAAQVLELVKGL